MARPCGSRKTVFRIEANLGRPVEVGKNSWLDFTHRAGEIPQLEANMVLNGDLPEETFENKIIIIGDHFSSQTRFFSTPIHRGGDSLTALSRAVISIDTELRTGWVTILPAYVPFVLALIIIAVSITTYIKQPFIRFKLVTLVSLAAVSVVTFALLKLAHLWLPPAASVFTILSTGLILYLASYREGKQIIVDVLENVISRPTCAVLVYFSNGEQKYLTDSSDKFLQQFDLQPVSLSLYPLLAKLADFDSSETEELLDSATGTTRKIEFSHESGGDYELSIGPLKKADSGPTDLLVTISQAVRSKSSHSEPPRQQVKLSPKEDQADAQEVGDTA